jgi:hypothetical protein
MLPSSEKPNHRQNRVICIPCDLKKHQNIIHNAEKYRVFLDRIIKASPELFPKEINQGYLMKDRRYSSKLKVYQRRILVNSITYTIKPSCCMPYMTGLTDEIETALYFRQFNVPYEALEYAFGHDAMYWYRLETQLGRYPLVGSTIKESEQLPEHIVADEKHTKHQGQKAYIATTCAQECVLGVSVSKKADEKSLTQAYSVFKDEARQLDPKYSPKTVNVDGWQATINAWLNLFPQVFIIFCFFHVFLSLKQKSTKHTKAIFTTLSEKLWNCYQAVNKSSFSQRTRRLYEWAVKNNIPPAMLDKITKFKQNITNYQVAYQYPNAYRTSNLLDRLMVRMDHRLFDSQYFHGTLHQAQLGIRAWALIHNFAPSTAVTIRKHNGWQSPAERLNQHRYHNNWLHNLLVSAHRSQRKQPPPNPL